jgi:anti-anti-sigma factor
MSVEVCWEDRHARLTLDGELDWATASVLSERLTEVVAEQPEQVTVDLANVGFMDCAGISPLAMARRALPDKCPLVLATPIPRVRKLLTVTGFDTVDGVLIA